jgi:hypothetical protein
MTTPPEHLDVIFHKPDYRVPRKWFAVMAAGLLCLVFSAVSSFAGGPPAAIAIPIIPALVLILCPMWYWVGHNAGRTESWNVAIELYRAHSRGLHDIYQREAKMQRESQIQLRATERDLRKLLSRLRDQVATAHTRRPEPEEPLEETL